MAVSIIDAEFMAIDGMAIDGHFTERVRGVTGQPAAERDFLCRSYA
jgi:hypothetical protein